MYFLRANFDGDINLGLHGFATDKYCFLGSERYAAKIKDILKVKTHAYPLLNMDLVRLFCTGNSTGLVMPQLIHDYDLREVENIQNNFEVLLLKTRFTSVGNLLLLNDKGIILSPLLKKHKREVEKFFGLSCEMTTIAGLNLVGSLGFATNRGCLAHPKLREREKRIIERTLDVTVDIGTVNFGSPYPGSGLIGNSHGFVASESCSGPELGRITDVLGFLQE